MPVFSGNNVDTLMNKLDTKRLDVAIDKKKYDSSRQEIQGVFENNMFGHKSPIITRQDSTKSARSSKTNFFKLTKTDKRVIDSYIQHRQKLEVKKLHKVFINVLE